MPKSIHLAKCGSAAVVLLAAAATCGAQVMQAPGTMPNGTRVPFPQRQFDQRQGFRPPQPPPQQAVTGQPGQPAQPSTASAANAKPAAATAMQTQATPPSLLDKPAQPAKVALNSGGLTVTADNSSLTQILHEISSSTGMAVDGLNNDQRVFGSYGPANPREVLSSLLEDSGYNVMMVGANSDGAPKQLFLTPRDASASATANNPQQDRPMMPPNRDDDADEELPPPAEPDTPPPGNAVQGPNQQTPPGVVRSPQQMLQELEQMRQQQQSQQPPQ
jgi:hypothetical protein